MARVVKKFGGTSLQSEKRIRLAVEKVGEDLRKGNEVISVVSAMGREGDPYATDTLIGLMEEVSSEIDPLKQDLIMSCGEVISASLFSHYLDDAGYESVPMTGYQAGILTDSEFGNARIMGIDPARMENYLNRGKSLVLAGFQGNTLKGEVTTLGRGGSDTTALRVGGAVNAEIVEIYTDVPGVAVVNPGMVDNPPFFESVPRSAMLSLAENGASVIHPRAVSAAREYDVPFSIKCSWEDGRGTVVGSDSSPKSTPLGLAVLEDCSLVEGSEAKINDILEMDTASSALKFTGDDGKCYLLWKKGGIELEDYEVNSVYLVTAVPTISDRVNELLNRVVERVDGDSYIEKMVEREKVSFVVTPGTEKSLVRDIYGLFY